MEMDNSFETWSQMCEIEAISPQVAMLHIKSGKLRESDYVVPLAFPEFERGIAWNRPRPWWLRSHCIDSAHEIPAGSEYLLLKVDENRHVAIMPVVGSGVRFTVEANDGTPVLKMDGIPPEDDSMLLPVAIVSVGTSPLHTVRQAVESAADRLQTFVLRKDKTTPRWIDYFGWCTWDAFYFDVSAEKVFEGLQAFKDAGFPPRLFILDDGWLTVDEKRQLCSFEAHHEKFPEGLAAFVHKVKDEYGVACFGIWHALQGYWNGVREHSELGSKYRLIDTFNPTPETPGNPPAPRTLVHPDDIAAFYDDFYSFLSASGVDMVKVDNQGSLPEFCPEDLSSVDVMQAYQDAVQAAAVSHMENNILHCMAQIHSVFFYLNRAQVIRNSDDFRPTRDHVQGAHLVVNAMNSIWTSHFGIQDWDMFQSEHPFNEYHAAARAISGGPVYVSDQPGKHNIELLRKLCTSDGRVLRCEEPAMPSEDCVYVDFSKHDRFLKITNHNGRYGTIGLFHCGEYPATRKHGTQTDSFKVSDMPACQSGQFGLYFYRSQKVVTSGAEQAHFVELSSGEYELITSAPMDRGVAVFGLLDKFNSSRAVVSNGWRNSHVYEVVLLDGGRCGFYSETSPESVYVDRAETKDWSYDAQNHSLVVSTAEGKARSLEVMYA